MIRFLQKQEQQSSSSGIVFVQVQLATCVEIQPLATKQCMTKGFMWIQPAYHQQDPTTKATTTMHHTT